MPENFFEKPVSYPITKHLVKKRKGKKPPKRKKKESSKQYHKRMKRWGKSKKGQAWAGFY